MTETISSGSCLLTYMDTNIVMLHCGKQLGAMSMSTQTFPPHLMTLWLYINSPQTSARTAPEQVKTWYVQQLTHWVVPYTCIFQPVTIFFKYLPAHAQVNMQSLLLLAFFEPGHDRSVSASLGGVPVGGKGNWAPPPHKWFAHFIKSSF